MKKSFLKGILLLAMFTSLFLIPAAVQAKTYYSTKQVGLTGKYDFMTGQKYRILSVKGNTVRYCTVRIVEGRDGISLKFGKTKKAALTSKTKYYKGDINRYYIASRSSTAEKNKKWILKVTKSAFKKALNGRGWWDRIIVKNGKVQKIFINMQLAG